MPDTSETSRLFLEERVGPALRELGLPMSLATQRRQSFHLDCTDLVSVGCDALGREQRMERRATARWEEMKAAAVQDGIVLTVISAFRSFDHQKQIIARKLAAGKTIDEILAVNALPGFSEHHSGRALDLGTPGCPALTADFEHTPAFAWLVGHAAEFGFHLTYFRGNSHGVMFEPWHWMFHPAARPA